MSTPKTRLLSLHVVLVAIYFLAGGAAGTKIFLHEQATSRLINKIAAQQDLNHVTNMDVNLNPGKMGVVTSFLLKITSKNFTNTAKAKAAQQEILDMIGRLKQEIFASTVACIALVACTALFLAASRWWPGAGAKTPERQIYDLLAVSLIFFAIGISSPVMTAAVKGSHMLVGGFVIETDSKGIISTVVSLFRSGNWIISVLLTGFSIGIPIFKGIAVLATVLQPSAAKRARIGQLLEAIGKWSLTDVVVAAVLLGIFSLNAIKEADGGVSAVPRFALGFFIGYCVLAAFTSSLLRRSAKHPAAAQLPGSRRTAATALLILALGAGIGAGFHNFHFFRGTNAVTDAAVIKLVRTHAELLNDKFKMEAGQPAAIPFEVPFASTLIVDLKVSGGAPLLISVIPDDGRPVDTAPAAVPLKVFPVEETLSYQHAQAVAAGKYRLLVRPNPLEKSSAGSRSFSLHLSVDP
jgi:hypothetical protein